MEVSTLGMIGIAAIVIMSVLYFWARWWRIQARKEKGMNIVPADRYKEITRW